MLKPVIVIAAILAASILVTPTVSQAASLQVARNTLVVAAP